MTSSSTYKSMLRVDTGNPRKHLPRGDDVIGNSVTSLRNSLPVARPVASHPASADKSQMVFVSMHDDGDGRANKSEAPSGECNYNGNYHDEMNVTSRTSRAVHSDLETSTSLCQSHQPRFSCSDVIKLTLSPTSESRFDSVSIIIIIIILIIIIAIALASFYQSAH